MMTALSVQLKHGSIDAAIIGISATSQPMNFGTYEGILARVGERIFMRSKNLVPFVSV
jgi:hypothetical protein